MLIDEMSDTSIELGCNWMQCFPVLGGYHLCQSPMVMFSRFTIGKLLLIIKFKKNL